MDQAKDDCNKLFNDIGSGLASSTAFVAKGLDSIGKAVDKAAAYAAKKVRCIHVYRRVGKCPALCVCPPYVRLGSLGEWSRD